MEPLEIKKLSYAIATNVAYVVFGHDVYFCGLENIRTLPGTYSVITSVNSIIKKITDAIAPEKAKRIFAILNHINWVCSPGEYDLRKIVLEDNVGERKSMNWEWQVVKHPCPREVLDAFESELGSNPRPMVREKRNRGRGSRPKMPDWY